VGPTRVVAAAVSTDRALRARGDAAGRWAARAGWAKQDPRRGGEGAPAGPRLEASPKGGRVREFPFLFFS
jgi:hypothetical protein